MTTMQPAARNNVRTNIALAGMLVLGSIFFFACVSGFGGSSASTDWSLQAQQPGRIVLASE